MKTVYKIVHNTENPNRFVSSSVSSQDFILEYQVGKKTIPRKGKIFAFKSLKLAQEGLAYFCMNPSGYSIFKAVTFGSFTEIPICCGKTWINQDLEKFWDFIKESNLNIKTLNSYPDTVRMIKGTVLVDDLTLIEKVI